MDLKSYQWQDPRLKRKYYLYAWSLVGFGVLALAVIKLMPSLPEFVFLGLIGIAVVFFVLSLRMKSKDLSLKRNVGKPLDNNNTI